MNWDKTNIECIADDVFLMVSSNAKEWAAAGPSTNSRANREVLNSTATQMYVILTGDTELKELRHAPQVVTNYITTNSYFGTGQIVIFFQQENNGNTLRAVADLDYQQLSHFYEDDDCKLAAIHGEFINPDGIRVGLPVDFERAANFVMPFGKHKGKRLTEIPKDYLRWFMENTDNQKMAKLCRLVCESQGADA